MLAAALARALAPPVQSPLNKFRGEIRKNASKAADLSKAGLLLFFHAQFSRLFGPDILAKDFEPVYGTFHRDFV